MGQTGGGAEGRRRRRRYTEMDEGGVIEGTDSVPQTVTETEKEGENDQQYSTVLRRKKRDKGSS